MGHVILSLVFGVGFGPGDGRPAPSDEAVRASAEKAIPLLVKGIEGYAEKRDCFSCHHQAVPVFALATARSRGLEVPEDTVEDAVALTDADLREAIESYRKGNGQGGGVHRAGYALFTLEVGGAKPDDLTDAVADYLLRKDEDRGHWRSSSDRPPSEASEFSATYFALRSLKAYGRDGREQKAAARAEKARRWLETAAPRDTEDRVFRLLAMSAAGSPEDSIREAADDLLKTRNADGGWSQLEGGTSDAYATATALVALHLAGGLATDDPAYRQGLGFLISSQLGDGSWHVASRSKPFQPYFESGFPHGKDQFLSMAASAWAVSALCLALPAK
ncbi:MAG: prenyltransferase/squalene oxidase repeat-containing protein [Isosphaeraceae bacterium]